MSSDVRVVYRKYDGSLHWHMTLRRLGADEHGVWLGAPAGSTSRRGSEPPVTLAMPYVLLVPAGQWWSALFNGEPARTEVYCDITTVADWDGDQVTMVDLDLDTLRSRDGRVKIVDQDEFAEHQVKYGYPPDVIAAAEEAAHRLHTLLGDGTEPFATAFRPWLAQVT